MTLVMYCPWLYCNPFFFYFIVSGLLFSEKRFCSYIYYHLFIYVLLSRRKGWDHINRSIQPHVYVCPKQGPGFLTSYVVVCLCSMIWGERWLFVFFWYWRNCWLFKLSFHNQIHYHTWIYQLCSVQNWTVFSSPANVDYSTC